MHWVNLPNLQNYRKTKGSFTLNESESGSERESYVANRCIGGSRGRAQRTAPKGPDSFVST